MRASAIRRLGAIVPVPEPFALRPAPPGGRQRMPLAQRAKIFIPFDPLEGFSDALRSAELRVEMEKRAQDEHPAGDDFDD